MTTYIRQVLVFLVVFIASHAAMAQGVDSMMQVYAGYPQQKVYVHFDKSLYSPGETIWFKAYLFDGFEPTSFSRNLYAELVDSKGMVVQRKVYPVVEASASGNFDLPANTSGKLGFRAYTNWMLNFDTAFMFSKDISIFDANQKTATTPAPAQTTQLQFFPEGGDLVNGLESVVAFKANNPRGKPVFIKGDVKNSKGEVVATFSARHNGMGSFTLTPQAGEKYTATATDEFGNQLNVTLPAARPEGLVLSVTNAGQRKVFIIKRSAGAADAIPMVNIVAHMAQQIVYKAKVPLTAASLNSGAIPTDQLPSGILQLTVFNEKFEPLAERIVFVNNNNYRFPVSLDTNIVNLEKRGKNILEIRVSDTLKTNMSIAVTDADLDVSKQDDNIYAGLLLTGDVKGYVHQPAYYFKNTADTTLQNLDLVMLTHGWRRYNWSSLVAGRTPYIKYPNDPPLGLVAKVFGVNPASPLRSNETLTAILQMKDSSTQILELPKIGPTEFGIRNMLYFDTLKVYYQFNVDRGLSNRTSLLFENGFYKGPRIVDMPAFPFANIDSLALRRARTFNDEIKSNMSGRVNILQSVIVRTRVRSPKEELDSRYTSGFFAGGDAITFDFVNDQFNMGFPDIFSYLQGRVAGLQISTAGAQTSLQWRGGTPSVFLNEMPVDVQTLTSIPVADIAYVKVFRPPFFGAMGGGAGGAIAVYTRRGGDQPATPGIGLPRGTAVGYSIAKQFYSPDYSKGQEEVDGDFRSTLYWNPFVFTDARQQSAKIEFYNNDISRSLRVVVEGVDEFGRLIHIEKVLKPAR